MVDPTLNDDIIVSVEPTYLEERSEPVDDYYVWAYRVKIRNDGDQVVRLRSRYWRITDAQGRVQEVQGFGVVGEQPVLQPGDTFEYTSGTPLNTPSGIMSGNYHMETLDGEVFTVRIPAFSLDSPYETGLVH
ncbi:MAG: Co2+/Mg2+ efflux protein ApaG [Pseudomonadota bacterium]